MTWIDAAGWLAAALTLAAYSMRTMLPLRSAAIGANLSFIAYGAAIQVYPMLVLHLCLLPLNVARLAQILRDRHRAMGGGTDSFGALRPFMRPVSFEAGEQGSSRSRSNGSVYRSTAGCDRCDAPNRLRKLAGAHSVEFQDGNGAGI